MKKENNNWIFLSERKPSREEYLENDGRFIVTDGNRCYQSVFDIYDGKFKADGYGAMLDGEDKRIIAWQPFPAKPYVVGSDESSKSDDSVNECENMKGHKIMNEMKKSKGNLVASYLFAQTENIIKNIDIELEMQNDLAKLAEEWKKKGYIKRYMVGPFEGHYDNDLWIPVNEDTPISFKDVLCWCEDTNNNNETYLIGWYDSATKEWTVDYDNYDDRYYKVVAWQPLPKGYLAED